MAFPLKEKKRVSKCLTGFIRGLEFETNFLYKLQNLYEILHISKFPFLKILILSIFIFYYSYDINWHYEFRKYVINLYYPQKYLYIQN